MQHMHACFITLQATPWPKQEWYYQEQVRRKQAVRTDTVRSLPNHTMVGQISQVLQLAPVQL